MSLNALKSLKVWFISYCLPKQALTQFAGLVANVTNKPIKNFIIQQFIKTYEVNMQEALIEDPLNYSCFNDFFIRHLKPESRPLAQATVISPVDGCVSEIGRIEEGQLIQAKGHNYAVEEFLACDKGIVSQFVHGQFATLYLSPKDYHRIHMPIDATLKSMTYIPGALFSVQPATTQMIPKLFARNERLVVFFDTTLGPMVMVLVGATVVGTIGTSWQGELKRSKKSYTVQYDGITFKQGDEMGYFKLGSTVVLLFANGEQLQWDKSWCAGTPIRLGQAMSLELN